MKVMDTVGSMLGILAFLMLSAGAVGNDSPPAGLSHASAADRVSPAAYRGDYHVVHAIWQRPSWVVSGHGPQDSKLWI